MICWFSISISLMLLNVDHGPVPGTSCIVIPILFLLCERRRARTHTYLDVWVCFFLLLYCRPAFSCRLNFKNLSIRKKIVVINFRGLAPQKIAKKAWDLNINTIIKPIILYIWCAVYSFIALAGFVLFNYDGDTGWREEKEKEEDGAGEKTHLYYTVYMRK